MAFEISAKAKSRTIRRSPAKATSVMRRSACGESVSGRIHLAATLLSTIVSLIAYPVCRNVRGTVREIPTLAHDLLLELLHLGEPGGYVPARRELDAEVHALVFR